ncbi:hypothetical protein PQQ51_01545 [Paraburkholderia xenovorans]|uniref:hypothetical protein n=1 Tax=Paraburkholderia xenovorans TaxID=36873 RepID=UPI0038BB8902
MTPVQSCGAKTAAASSAAVVSPAAAPVDEAPAADPSSRATCIVPRGALAGSAASASTIQRGITSVDAEYATSVISKATPVTIAANRIAPK